MEVEVGDGDELDEDGSAVDWEEEINDSVVNDEDKAVIEPEVRATSEDTLITLESDSDISEDSSISQISAGAGGAAVDRIDTLDSTVQLEAEEVGSKFTEVNASDRPYCQQEWARDLHFYCLLIVLLLLVLCLLILLGG